MVRREGRLTGPTEYGGPPPRLAHRGVTMMAPSHRKQLEALSAISDIIVKLSDEDLERLESLAEQMTPFDPELGDRILDASTLLTQLHDDVELALERLEPDPEDMEEEDDMEAAEAEAHATDMEDEEEAGEELGKTRSKRKK
jgi:hypothetical protein